MHRHIFVVWWLASLVRPTISKFDSGWIAPNLWPLAKLSFSLQMRMHIKYSWILATTSCCYVETRQKSFLKNEVSKNELFKNRPKLKFAVFHLPFYSNCSKLLKMEHKEKFRLEFLGWKVFLKFPQKFLFHSVLQYFVIWWPPGDLRWISKNWTIANVTFICAFHYQ